MDRLPTRPVRRISRVDAALGLPDLAPGAETCRSPVSAGIPFPIRTSRKRSTSRGWTLVIFLVLVAPACTMRFGRRDRVLVEWMPKHCPVSIGAPESVGLAGVDPDVLRHTHGAIGRCLLR